MKDCGIYIIVNLATEEEYIGQSKTIGYRLKNHISLLEKNKHGNSHLQRSWNKYKKENFSFSVLEYCEEKELDEKEKFYILSRESKTKGFNQDFGGKTTKKRRTKGICVSCGGNTKSIYNKYCKNCKYKCTLCGERYKKTNHHNFTFCPKCRIEKARFTYHILTTGEIPHSKTRSQL